MNANADCIAAGAHNCLYQECGHKENESHGNIIGQLDKCTLFHPMVVSVFILRLLLTVVKGMLFLLTISSNKPLMYFLAATSYQALWTVNDVLCDIFKDACLARGLLDDDKEWLLCLQKASGMCTGQGLLPFGCFAIL